MLLAGDVGGTNTRLGVFAPAEPRPVLLHARTYATTGFATLAAMLVRFLDDVGVGRDTLTAAAFGVAGPVVGDEVQLTNIDWRVNAGELAAALGVPRVRLLNDLLAMAHAIPVLRPDELVELQAGTRDPRGNVALIAPGTGLGEAFLVNVDGRLVAIPSEGGHADFAPRSPRETALLAFLTGRFGRADYERVLSGPGLVNLFHFTHDAACRIVDPSAADAAARITAAARDRTCPRCVEALDLFVSTLGAEAGNAALRTVATGGVYLGGGIPPKILPALRTRSFLAAFRAKAPLADLVAAVPVLVIVEPDPGLLGAAVAASGAS
ncbi:MAG: glucokinase [Acidobacteria bacterium]|nr:glucokinase [Acidobacteriota bacterium]